MAIFKKNRTQPGQDKNTKVTYFLWAWSLLRPSNSVMRFTDLISMADSWVWAHFTKPDKKGEKALCGLLGSNGKPCGAQIAYTSSTSSLAYHLTSVHGLEKGTPSKKKKTLKWGPSIGKSQEFPLNERELLCVTWASNGLP